MLPLPDLITGYDNIKPVSYLKEKMFKQSNRTQGSSISISVFTNGMSNWIIWLFVSGNNKII